MPPLPAVLCGNPSGKPSPQQMSYVSTLHKTRNLRTTTAISGFNRAEYSGSTLLGESAGLPGRIVHSRSFSFVINCFIFVSAIQMGAQADLGDDGPEWLWQVCEHGFTSLFALEMVLRISALWLSYFSDPWNVLDFFIVWVSIVSAWLLPALRVTSGSVNFGTIKAFRLLRLFRIMRIMKAVPELRMVIEGIGASMRAMVWVFILFVIVTYTFSIFCVEALGHSDAGFPGFDPDTAVVRTSLSMMNFNNFEFFGDVRRAMLSLFSMTLLAEWDAIRPVFEYQQWTIPVFALLISVTTFGIVNVIIGVIVERTTKAMDEMDSWRRERHKMHQMAKIEDLAEAVWEMDKDKNGTLSKEEMCEAAKNPLVMEMLIDMDLPKGFTLSEFHMMLNFSGRDELTQREFVNGMHRLIFLNEFQRDCLSQLAAGHTRVSVVQFHKVMKEGIEAQIKSFRHEMLASHGALLAELCALRLASATAAAAANLQLPEEVSPSPIPSSESEKELRSVLPAAFPAKMALEIDLAGCYAEDQCVEPDTADALPSRHSSHDPPPRLGSPAARLPMRPASRSSPRRRNAPKPFAELPPEASKLSESQPPADASPGKVAMLPGVDDCCDGCVGVIALPGTANGCDVQAESGAALAASDEAALPRRPTPP